MLARHLIALGLWPLLGQSSPPTKQAPAPDASAESVPPRQGQTTPQEPQIPSAPRSWAPSPVARASAEVLAQVLPCGLRVLVAQDPSLPVASVVLSVPSGQVDDPGRNPGLIHALAYAQQMGNRELSPGAALDEVYDSGGYAEMAVGAGQTRFESLVPQWSLRGVLRVEADRFATPTLNQPLWLKALQFASQDRRPAHGPHLPQRAAAFALPGLSHDGRVVLPQLGEIPLPALARYQSQHFRHDRSTLAVVSAAPPEQTLKLLESVFSRVKPSSRATPKAAPEIPARPGTTSSTDNKNWFLRALPADPPSQWLALLFCQHLNRRSPPLENGHTLPGLACDYHQSPTHPFLQIRAKASAQEKLASRLASIAGGAEDALLAARGRRIYDEHRAGRSGALALARHLASLPDWKLGSSPEGYTLSNLLGEPAYLPNSKDPDPAALREAIRALGLLDPQSYRMAKAVKAAKREE